MPTGHRIHMPCSPIGTNAFGSAGMEAGPVFVTVEPTVLNKSRAITGGVEANYSLLKKHGRTIRFQRLLVFMNLLVLD